MSETLTISKANALTAWGNASDKLKKVLENLFGKETFENIKITDRVKTFEDALAIVGASDNLKTLLDYNGLDKLMLSSVAFAKLSIIAEALNEGWSPDWENNNENKYYPWFKHKSGFGLSYGGYDGWDTYAGVGSRLCFANRETAKYAAETFMELYERCYLISK